MTELVIVSTTCFLLGMILGIVVARIHGRTIPNFEWMDGGARRLWLRARELELEQERWTVEMKLRRKESKHDR